MYELGWRLCQMTVMGSVLLAFTTTANAQRTPGEELKALRPADGLRIEVFASEPMIANPAAIDVDTQGRVWVAEIRYYRREAREPGADVIRVLEDSDDDGHADRATVFAEGLMCPMSICVAGPRVYVATSPELWVYEDLDGDLRADGPPQKLLTGFGGYNHDHGAHSLVLGPDHKWWMSNGDRGFDVRGSDGSQVAYNWGAVIRGELDGSRLETVAHNFRNPYEVCVSSFGESFLSDNDNDGLRSTRICWLLDGGDYGWFGHPPAKPVGGLPFSDGWHFRAHVPGFVPGTLVTGFGSPCGICFYEGAALGDAYRHTPIHADAGPREVRAYPHRVDGYGMQAESQQLITSAGDDYFRPVDVCAAPDGSLFVADWYDGGVGGHAYNDPERGRIFRVCAADIELQRSDKPGPYEQLDDALAGLASPNLATQFLAREYLLAHATESVAALRDLVEAAEPHVAARALWVLDRIGGQARSTVFEQLQGDDPRFRALGVRILRRHGDEFAGQILAMAGDADVEVRREVLLALRSIDGGQAEQVLSQYVADYQGDDRYLLEAINVAVVGSRREALFDKVAQMERPSVAQLELAVALDRTNSVPLLGTALFDAARPLEKRLTIAGRLGSLATLDAAKPLVVLLANVDAAVSLRGAALAAFDANLAAAWRRVRNDDSFVRALGAAVSDVALRPRVIEVITRHNLKQFGRQLLDLSEAEDVDLDLRGRCLGAAAGAILSDAERERLLQIAARFIDSGDERLVPAAIRALAALQAWSALGDLVLDTGQPMTARLAAVESMLANGGGPAVLLRWLESAKLAGELAEHVLAAATVHPDINVREQFERYLPEDQRPVKLGEEFSAGDILALEGNASRGQSVFTGSSALRCQACHSLWGRGGNVGPDLSQIGRKYERAALLETILEPSRAIAPEYVAHAVETVRGQVYLGCLVHQDDERIVLRAADGHETTIARDEIEAMDAHSVSLMPELLLRDATAQDAADLLAFLLTLRDAKQYAWRAQVLGPFAGDGGQALDEVLPPEASSGSALRPVAFDGLHGTVRWESIDAREQQDGGALAAVFDIAAHSRQRLRASRDAVFYMRATIESDAEQDALLTLSTNERLKLWIDDRPIDLAAQDASQGLEAGKAIRIPLRSGTNRLLLKLYHREGASRLSLALDGAAEIRWAGGTASR